MKYIASNIMKAILIAILSGLLCNCLWILEIIQIKGWTGLNWLSGYMNTVILIIPLTVLAFILSLRLFEKVLLKNLITSFLLLSIISWISYEIAREFLYEINSRFFGFSNSLTISIIIVLTGILVPNLFYSIGYYYITNRFLIKIQKMTILLFFGSIVFSIIFGLITLNINSGFGSGTTFIDSVKMGYPIFWLNIFLGLIVIIIIKMNKKLAPTNKT
jgi:hypothetical protein